MTNFFYKNKYKLIFVVFLAFLLLTLTSCRFDPGDWAQRPYTSYADDWSRLWDNGNGFFNTLFAWPVNLLSYPIAWLCSNIGKACNSSYFLGILFTTLIVRTLAWPIYSKTNDMSVKMAVVQPEMARIQAKYGNRKDPQSQQQMQAEMMKLYKKYKINPLGCFGTMIIQWPIFMSMYEVVQRINVSIPVTINGAVGAVVNSNFALADTKFHLFGAAFEMNTSFFNAPNISDKIFAVVVALILGGIQILTQKLSSRPPKYQKKYPNAQNSKQQGQAKQMKIMMYVMNLMFVFMALSNTSLGIYWVIGGIYQIFQTQVGRIINEKNYNKAQQKNNM